jgi:hypothetical protein
MASEFDGGLGLLFQVQTEEFHRLFNNKKRAAILNQRGAA